MAMKKYKYLVIYRSTNDSTTWLADTDSVESDDFFEGELKGKTEGEMLCYMGNLGWRFVQTLSEKDLDNKGDLLGSYYFETKIKEKNTWPDTKPEKED